MHDNTDMLLEEHPAARVGESDVDTAEELDEFLKLNDFAVVEFYSDRFPPSRILRPVIMRAVSSKYEGRIALLSVNVDSAAEVAAAYGVQSVPDVRIFKYGRLFHAAVGARPESYYESMLDEILRRDGE